MSIANVIALFGGVALFLFGMQLMGDGLKKVAGNKLELVLWKLSGTPVKGIILGTVVTAVIQSSSATSAMVVGFVNTGMMTITQSISIVMGANIGTSITGWLLCLSLLGGQGGWLSTSGRREKQAFRDRLALLDMGLEDRMKQPVGLLSGGQRQALTLMMATLSMPKILLLDEHTAALDPGTAEKVLALTTKIVAENDLTCLMITHNMQSALDLGNRTIMMDAGRIVFDTTGEERKALTVDDLLQKFREASGKALDNDRMLLT